VNKRRLLKLADLLEADAKNKKGIKFDLGTWGNSDDDEVSVSCGTTACAMGLAVVSGAFKRAGLTNHYSDNADSICPRFDGYVGFAAAAALFDIEYNAATFLFEDTFYPEHKKRGAAGERYVAKRIRDFVAGKVTPPKVES
jgi:hypothetical protein